MLPPAQDLQKKRVVVFKLLRKVLGLARRESRGSRGQAGFFFNAMLLKLLNQLMNSLVQLNCRFQ